MKTRLLPLLLLPALFAPAAQAFDDGDFQTWLTLSASHKVNTNWTIRVEEEMYFGDDSSERFYYHTDVGAARKVNEVLSVGLYYRLVQSEKENSWLHEDRPHLDFVFKNVLGDVNVQNRARFEYRIRENMDEVLRYRHRLQLQLPVKPMGVAMTPYVSEELFIDSDQGDFNEFRTSTGLKKKISAAFEGDLYYLWQTVDKNTFWQDAHILGLAGSFQF